MFNIQPIRVTCTDTLHETGFRFQCNIGRILQPYIIKRVDARLHKGSRRCPRCRRQTQRARAREERALDHDQHVGDLVRSRIPSVEVLNLPQRLYRHRVQVAADVAIAFAAQRVDGGVEHLQNGRRKVVDQVVYHVAD